MTKEELSRYDGIDGRRAYVAVNGTIYDFTDSPRWPQGEHPGGHLAGRDLTEELRRAPHVRTLVERFPVVGRLEEEAPPKSRPQWGWWLLAGVAVGVLVVWLIF